MPAPGFMQWQRCTGGHDVPGSSIGDGSQPDGLARGFFIEHFDAVNGVENQYWTPAPAGVGSGQFSNSTQWDSHANSGGVHYQLPMSKQPSSGEVIGLTIGGQWLGCMMYMGTSSQQVLPQLFPAATPDPYGQIPPGQDHYWEPQQATASQTFSDCYGCVWGATDPMGPIDGWEEEADSEMDVKPPPPESGDPIEDAQLRKRPPSGNDERKKLREEVTKIKRLIGY